MTKVVSISVGNKIDGCHIYRVAQPLYHLGQHHPTQIVDFEQVRSGWAQYGPGFFLAFVQAHDVFVLPRFCAAEDRMLKGISSLIQMIRLVGKRVVYEVDDDLSNDHRDLRASGITHALDIASWCDAITVTTPYLAESVSKKTGRPAYVLPNMVDPAAWNQPQRFLEHEGVVIGLSGSSTHYNDWKVVAEPLKRILQTDYGFPVTLQLTGFHPDYLREFPNTVYLPALDYQTYVEAVRASDIVIAPVNDEQFNLGKSPIKVIEGMAASRPDGGAAVMASDNPVYRLAIQPGKTGLLVQHTEEAWYNGIDTLLRNTALRQQLQAEGAKWVWKRHDISREWMQWARAYDRILRRPSNTAPLPYLF